VHTNFQQVDKSTLDFETALISTLLKTNSENQSREDRRMQTFVFVAKSFSDLATENIFR
jgi:hypothetical protein